MTTTYALTSVKGSRTVDGDLQQAIKVAASMERDLQPAFGITISRGNDVIAEVRDGAADMSPDAIVATLIEYMPAYLRKSHRAAGNRGLYPHNGAQRVWVAGMVDADDLDDWSCVVAHADELPSGEDVLDDIPADALANVEE